MKHFAVVTLALVQSLFVLGNAAQPGIWNGGGTSNFSLLYPEDSSAFQKIQMEKELVSIQLYKGFAAVKGKYWMRNSTEDTVEMKCGYPVNTWYTRELNNHITQVHFDSLMQMQVKVEGELQPLKNHYLEAPDAYDRKSVWYTWKSTFLPGTTTPIEVYFIVNTNDAYIREGYAKDHSNAFLYLLESGSTWKQPIGAGEIRIQMMEGLTLADIHGLEPAKLFQKASEGSILVHQFQNLSPTEKDNVVVTYWEEQRGFDFANAQSLASSVFQALDEFSSLEINEAGLSPFTTGNPFDVNASDELGSAGFFKFFTMPILLVAFIIFLIWRIMKRVMAKKNEAGEEV